MAGRHPHVIFLSPKRNKSSKNTRSVVRKSLRGSVTLSVSGHLSECLGTTNVRMQCSHGSSAFGALARHARLTLRTGTSVFVDVRYGGTTNGDTHKVRAFAVTFRSCSSASTSSHVTGGHHANGACSDHGSDLNCVVRSTLPMEHKRESHKLERTQFRMLHGTTVPTVLVRYNFLSGRNRTTTLTDPECHRGLTRTVTRNVVGCFRPWWREGAGVGVRVLSIGSGTFGRCNGILRNCSFASLFTTYMGTTPVPRRNFACRTSIPRVRALPVTSRVGGHIFNKLPVRFNFIDNSGSALGYLRFREDDRLGVTLGSVVLLLNGIARVRSDGFSASGIGTFGIPTKAYMRLFKAALRCTPYSNRTNNCEVVYMLPHNAGNSGPSFITGATRSHLYVNMGG